MYTNLRSSAVAAVMLALVLILALGLVTSPRRSAVAVEPEPAADSPDQYVWTLVYRIATKPEGETVAVPMGASHQMQAFYTYVKEFRVRPDGTFAFDECDFGFLRQEDDFTIQGIGKVSLRGNRQGLLRGSGKWQPATGATDETLTLKLEWGAGDGANETRLNEDENTSTVKHTASPDGRTVTTTSEPPGGKPLINSYPNPFVISEWTLKPNQAAPDRSRGAIQSRLNGIPVSLVAAPDDECDDKKEQKFQGGRPTTLICSGGAKTPVTESVTVKKRKKEADLAVSLGGEEGHPLPGSSGNINATVRNHGPCEAHATLTVTVMSGVIGGKDVFLNSRVRVISFSDGTPEPRVDTSTGESGDSYKFTYQFTLANGESKTVVINAKDTTPPGQTLPYAIASFADVAGDLPDPNGGNNHVDRTLTFAPPKKTPPKPAPSKAK